MARGNGGDINEGVVMGLREGDAGDGRGRPARNPDNRQKQC